MIKALHKMGIRSGMMYTAGIMSVGASFLSWVLSKEYEQDIARADRWGLFVGEWAPTFFAMGLALRFEEQRQEMMMSGMVEPGYEETGGADERMARRLGGRATART
ncbi:hypothetical protein GCM10009677_23400 [Sphaerisporangium rubeum]|uniref:Uncharacterized protein n=1 Tax=Sphaerisporangium rubeum TaxID=321317 RepID=A0A7X0M9F5_9ACTN|nr:hypothetical protein [Sphaerisporangium rubeum]MBB6476417.1 hypothetical protein [Sphaerisporangium rubeum]